MRNDFTSQIKVRLVGPSVEPTFLKDLNDSHTYHVVRGRPISIILFHYSHKYTHLVRQCFWNSNNMVRRI